MEYSSMPKPNFYTCAAEKNGKNHDWDYRAARHPDYRSVCVRSIQGCANTYTRVTP